jgi:hypothetical protein
MSVDPRLVIGDEVLLTTSPSKWDESEAFNRMRRKVECLKVVNDCAERAGDL